MQELAQRRRLLERPLPKIGAATPKMPKLNLGPSTPTATATSSECGSPRSSTAAAAVAPALLAGVVAARHDVEAEFARCRGVLDRAYSSVTRSSTTARRTRCGRRTGGAQADQLAWEERERERRSSQLASWEEEDRAKWRAEERERQARMTALWDREEPGAAARRCSAGRRRSTSGGRRRRSATSPRSSRSGGGASRSGRRRSAASTRSTSGSRACAAQFSLRAILGAIL